MTTNEMRVLWKLRGTIETVAAAVVLLIFGAAGHYAPWTLSVIVGIVELIGRYRCGRNEFKKPRRPNRSPQRDTKVRLQSARRKADQLK